MRGRAVSLLAAALGALTLAPLARAPRYPQVWPRHPITPAPIARFQPLAGRLDLAGWRLVFDDRFDTLDVAPDGGRGRWFAPVHSDFGRARFLPPEPGGPFGLLGRAGGGGGLRIRAEDGPDGWTSGLMQTVDGQGHGFARRFGYFEMCAVLPDGPGTWPAFWLLTEQAYSRPDLPRGEIDVMEQYGRRPDRLHLAVHLWPAYADNSGGIAEPWTLSRRVNLPGMGRGPHCWGAMVEPRSVSFYYDRRALAGYPTLPAYRTPLYLLVDLAMHKRDIERAKGPYDLLVRSVRVWAPPP